jgi:hypothetical protein
MSHVCKLLSELLEVRAHVDAHGAQPLVPQQGR